VTRDEFAIYELQRKLYWLSGRLPSAKVDELRAKLEEALRKLVES